MYCKNCGKELPDSALFCSKCGSATGIKGSGEPRKNVLNESREKESPRNEWAAKAPDAPNAGFFALCFFFPIVGLILYLAWNRDYPLRAKSAGKGALIGFCVGLGLSLITTFSLIGIASCLA